MNALYARLAGTAALTALLLASPDTSAQVTLHTAADKAAYEATASPRSAPPAARMQAMDVDDVIIPRDGDFVLALGANDDGSTALIPLGFSFNLYGTTYDGVYINNNGNVTFTEPLRTFTPFAFPSDTPIVAPFFADVDTRGEGSGLVYYKAEPGRFTVLWEEVGYFNSQTDKRNTFELVLTDGTDPIAGPGNNVCLSYADMNWTTGAASGGEDGFGGTAAIAGANAGDDTSFFTLGRFDQPGDAYDGPGGASDGIDYLDGRDLCFSTSDSATNIPPIAQGIEDGDVIGIPYDPATRTIAGAVDFSFLSPETEQITSITSPDIDGSGDYDFGSGDFFAGSITLTTTDGNPATGRVEVSLSPAIGVTGGDDLRVTLVACDDDPDSPECAEVTVTFRLDPFPTRECVVADSWDVLAFDADASSGTEFIDVYAGGPGPLDLSGCTFVAFDPFSERVTLAVDLGGVDTLSPFEDARPFLVFGPDEIPDGPGAIAFVQGDAAVGDRVQSVLGRVAYAFVYLDDQTPVGVFPADEQPPAGARRATASGDLAAMLAVVREGASDGPALAVGPNPVRGAGTVTFRLGAEADVRVAVYDVLGREVAVLAEGAYGAGPHRAPFDAAAFPAGAYVVRLAVGGEAHTARVTVVR